MGTGRPGDTHGLRERHPNQRGLDGISNRVSGRRPL